MAMPCTIFQAVIYGNQPKFFLILKKLVTMLVERTNNNKIVITLSSSVDSFGLQRLIDYVKYLEATSKSKLKQEDVDKLADEVNASWWEKNRKRFIK
jgi:mevalonate kinase